VLHKSLHSLRFWLAPSLLFAAIIPAIPQTSSSNAGQEPVLKTEVRVVMVDVVVSGRKGKAVPDLRREDFQVFEDGRPQTMSFFEEHKVVPSAPSNRVALPPGVFSNVQQVQSSDALNVLLLDWLNTQSQDRPYAQAQIVEYLRQMPTGVPTAVFVLDSQLQLVKGFTANPSVLLAALDPQNSRQGQNASHLLTSAAQNAAEQQMVDMMAIMQAAPAAIQAVRDEQSQTSTSNTSKRISITLQAMQDLARYVSGLPGRKNVIWFSSAFPIDLFPRNDVPHEYGQQLKRTIDLLAQSRVSVYPVSATGLNNDFSPAMQPQPGNQGFAGMNGGGISNEIAMETLAKGTGGKAFYNTNGIGSALTQAVDLGSHYYTLTYTPLNGNMDGKFRNIEVKVRKRGYKVACRQGYYAIDSGGMQPDKSAPGDMLGRLVRFGMPDITQIPYTVHVTTINLLPSSHDRAFGPNNPVRRYLLDFSVPLEGLSVNYSPDGAYRDALTVLIATYDFEGKLLSVSTHKVDVTLQLADYAQARQQGLQLHDEIDVPQGDIYLRTGLSDLNSSNVGTLSILMNKSAADANVPAILPTTSSAERVPLSPMKVPSTTPEHPVESTLSNPTPLTPAHDITAVPLGPGDPSEAPVAGPPCKIEEVLPKLAKNAREFVEDMNHFTATELLERERLDRNGNAHVLARMQSDYVVAIENQRDGYTVSEYRKAPQGAQQFAGGITANGTPALALIFHSTHWEEFDMSCGNLVNLRGHHAWQIHFRQRKDRPATIATFRDGPREFPMLLSGTAWVDSSNYHLVHLDADLLQPISEEKLTFLHHSIDYDAVPFSARHTTLWLPKLADVTAEFNGQRLREKRSYSDFTLFAVETGQKIAAPKQPPQ
jgi:VWFA-related protein